MDGDLLGATAELNRLNVGKVELEERRVSDVSRVVNVRDPKLWT